MSKELIGVFDKHEIYGARDDQEQMWVSAEDIGGALGYDRPSERVLAILKEHRDEFINDYKEVRSTRKTSETLDKIGNRIISGFQFTLEGIILLCMFSRQPKAKAFRKWTKTVMKDVMTRGYHIASPHAALNESLVKSIIADVVHAVVTPLIESQDRRISEMQQRFTQVLVPAMPDISEWPTPTQRLRALRSSQDVAPLPLRFNSGGSFDLFVAERHNHEFGNYPRTRCRRYMGKRPEFVVEVCPETDDLIRRCFKTYMKQIWEQPSLGLVQRGEGARDNVKGEALDGETGKAKGSRQNKLVHMRFSRRRNVKRRIKSE